MASAKLRVGVIGLGKIAQTQYLPALVYHRGVELIALCDSSVTLARKVTALFGLSEQTAVFSIEQLICRRPEVVFILTHDHECIAYQLIDEGINLIVEKPLCWSSERAAALVRYAQEKGVRLFACYMKQFDPTFDRFAGEVRTAEQILSVNVQCCGGNNKKWCDPLYPIQKESAEEKSSAKAVLSKAWEDFYCDREWERKAGQLLLQLGIHQINMIHGLFGDYSVEACVKRERQGMLSIHSIFGKEGFPVNYSLIPVFNAPWDWIEQYTVVLPEKMIKYEPGCPFLDSSTARLRITDGSNGLGYLEYRGGYRNPFALMIDAMIYSLGEKGEVDERLSPIQAVRDLQTIEEMIKCLQGAK